jgi:hypothetical protein
LIITRSPQGGKHKGVAKTCGSDDFSHSKRLKSLLPDFSLKGLQCSTPPGLELKPAKEGKTYHRVG